MKLTIEMVSEITDIYMSGFNRMVTDRNFTPGELAAISALSLIHICVRTGREPLRSRSPAPIRRRTTATGDVMS